MRKIILSLFCILLLASFVSADITCSETMTRTTPKILVNPGESFTVNYNAIGTSGSYGVSVVDMVSGGCTPSGELSFVLTSPATTYPVTFTAPLSGSCNFHGDYMFGSCSLGDFVDLTITVNSSSPGTPDEININEFESNPVSGNEWIELYNPNSFSVDISGWKVYDGLTSPSLIYTIPASTTLNSHDYYTFDLTTTKLNNANEFVTLKDDSDVQVDQTDTLADNAGDGNTWQRTPNGANNWTFKSSTKDATNVVVTPPTPPTPSNVSDDLQINYVRGKINIDGGVAAAGVNYRVEVLSGLNDGYIYYGSVDDTKIPTSVIPTLLGNGYFDTGDNVKFSSGDQFIVSLVDFACSTTGTFTNGGNGDFNNVTSLFSLDCAVPEIAPVLDAIGNKVLNESNLLEFIVSATDLNAADTLEYSVIGLPAGATFNAGTRTFSWTPTFSQAGVYALTFKVNDSILVDTETITITVTNLNQPVVFSGLISDINFNEDTSASINLTEYFSDADGTAISYSATGQTSNLTINIVNGLATLTPVANWNGVQHVIFHGSDSNSIADSNDVAITVNPVNDEPTLSVPSVINKNEGDLVTIIATSTDVDNTGLTFDINDTRFTNNGNGNFTWQTNYNDEGTYNVKISVTDGVNVTSRDVTVNIIHANEPPVMLPIADISVLEDSGFTNGINLLATDNDGNSTIDRFIVYQEDVSKVDCVVTDRLLGIRPVANFYGPASCKIRVYDDSGAWDEETVSIIVNAVNDAPIIDSYSPLYNPVIGKNKQRAFSVAWHDADNSTADVKVKWFVDNVEQYLGNIFTFTSNDTLGTYEVKVTVDDGSSVVDKTWSLRVVSKPIADTYNGETTDFDAIDEEDLNLVHLILEKLPYGRIEFQGLVDLSNDGVDFDNYADIQFGLGAIDTSYFTPLAGRLAQITFWGLTETTTPSIYYNTGFTLERNNINQLCPASICTNITYNNGTLSFIAPFSSYKVGNAQTCSQLGGYLCTSNEICEGSLLSSIESSCCSQACTPTFSDLDICSSVSSLLEVTIKEPDSGDDFETGETIPVEIKIKNNADEDIEVDVDVSLYDVDDDDELEVESTEIDVDEGDSETITVEIPAEGFDEDNNHIIFVKVEGDGYCNQKYVSVDLKRKKHDVVISSFDIPGAMCGESIEVELEIENRGKKDETVSLGLRNNELGINLDESFEIEKAGDDDQLTRRYLIDLPDYISGEYPITASIDFTDGSDSMTETLYVVCQKTTTVVQQNAPTTGIIPSSTTSFRSSWSSSLSTECLWLLCILLAIGIILMIILIVLARYR